MVGRRFFVVSLRIALHRIAFHPFHHPSIASCSIRSIWCICLSGVRPIDCECLSQQVGPGSSYSFLSSLLQQIGHVSSASGVALPLSFLAGPLEQSTD